jgi:hypothetical protein
VEGGFPCTYLRKFRGGPERAVTHGAPPIKGCSVRCMMSFEEFDAIRQYDQRCGKDEAVMLSVVRDRRRLIEFAEQLLERVRQLEGKTPSG